VKLHTYVALVGKIVLGEISQSRLYGPVWGAIFGRNFFKKFKKLFPDFVFNLMKISA
jgi:hypothetical protein